MSWLVLTFISVIFRAVYGVMTKVMSGHIKVSAYTQATLLPLAAAVLTLLLAPFLGGVSLNLTGVDLSAVALVILGQGAGNLLYFAAIKDLTNGTAQIAFSSILVFNTLLALVFLDLHLSPLNVFGIVLLLVAILSVVRGRVELNLRGIVLMLLAALCFAVFQLASSVVSSQVSPISYLLIAYVGAAVVVISVKPKTVLTELARSHLAGLARVLLPTAAFSIGNFLFAYYAYRIAPQPAKVAILLTSQVVVTVFLSYLLLRERDHLWRKIVAALLIVIAAACIKM